jgi:hypothetical protein
MNELKSSGSRFRFNNKQQGEASGSQLAVLPPYSSVPRTFMFEMPSCEQQRLLAKAQPTNKVIISQAVIPRPKLRIAIF